MTNNNSHNEILKPFQSILHALAIRKTPEMAAQHRADLPSRFNDPRRMQTIRNKTERPFRIWDRLRESLSCPENMAAEMQMLAKSLTESIKPEELPTPLEACPEPPKSAAALARAKNNQHQTEKPGNVSRRQQCRSS